ncbi:hypothetical protein AZI86_10930 [Bdellovibrio bacteriovorus]|uniref:Aspartyl/asparaginy/proline hydroxylase domain-containing protein n=1 Tax=Bdellovibrio bacteriovorus TaxID=959 RepID=A0A150WLQ2_BDEBC|nr:hypothetical protein AZI86_10930 [Bdellovibrio bacteriovorus]
MNYGAYVLDEKFLTDAEIARLCELAIGLSKQSTPTHEAGKYASKLWSFIPLVENGAEIPDNVRTPEVNKVISFFKTPINMAVFYYLQPGGVLHPHRDLTGAKLNQRIRFHIPIQTNPKVVFKVSGEQVVMRPGTFWALDTSYVHSVRNDGNEVRVHIVIECDVNDWCKSLLVKPNLITKVHDIYYALYLGTAILKSLLVNSWKDPKYLKAQLGMGIRFIQWRSKMIFRRK